MEERYIKQYILDSLRYMTTQVEEDKCPPETLFSIARIMMKELDVRGTVKQFAQHYQQSESNIRNVLSRRYIPKNEKPLRQVTYRFGWFSSLVPPSWRNRS